MLQSETTDKTIKHRLKGMECIACGERATHLDAEGVPLCRGDYEHLCEHWDWDANDVR